MKVILVSFIFFGLGWAADEYTCDCGWRNAGRIGGATVTKRNEYPWQAGIGVKGYNTIYCAGTLVTKWHIVTAAGCVHDRDPEKIFLTVGNFYTADDTFTQKRDVEEIIYHEKFSLRQNINNIAVVVAKTPFVFTEDRFVGPACVPAEQLGELLGETVKIMGWGSGTMDESPYDNQTMKPLKEADLDVVPHARCNSGYKMCVQGEGKTFGRGDGGDPILWLDGNRFTLVGVFISQIERKSNPDIKIGLSTNVSPYVDWIQEKISKTRPGETTCHKIVN